MKAYYAPDSLRLVGKAWEVRRKLRQLVEAESKGKDKRVTTKLSPAKRREC